MPEPTTPWGTGPRSTSSTTTRYDAAGPSASTAGGPVNQPFVPTGPRTFALKPACDPNSKPLSSVIPTLPAVSSAWANHSTASEMLPATPDQVLPLPWVRFSRFQVLVPAVWNSTTTRARVSGAWAVASTENETPVPDSAETAFVIDGAV